MSRRLQRSPEVFDDVNLLLLGAWKHGARHVALQSDGEGLEIRFLGPDGAEQSELLALSYEHIVKRLRKMTSRHGRLRVNMAGHQWHVDAAVPTSQVPERIFFHLRPREE